MKSTLYKAESRGFVDHGWLQSYHSFSFSSYYNPERMNFGLLRVINDDVIAPTKGFPTHPHDNMEIISIPLSGELSHKDSMGNEFVIRHGEVQIMSAGSGVRHSEYNSSQDQQTNLLQIWIQTEMRDIDPRYSQQRFKQEERSNQLQLVVSPLETDLPGVKICQQAYLSLGDLSGGQTISYELFKQGHGVYVMVIEGTIEIDGIQLKKRDALGITDSGQFAILAQEDSQLLFIEVPLK